LPVVTSVAAPEVISREDTVSPTEGFSDPYEHVYYDEPDKLTIQLVPRSKEAGVHLDLHKLNPRLQ
jgi:hypothetical protein